MKLRILTALLIALGCAVIAVKRHNEAARDARIDAYVKTHPRAVVLP
jgi:hypothetical protein